MESLWEQTWEKPHFPALDRDRDTDVLIIGGGMADILCAYFLHCASIPYLLVEAETICSGITKNTTAKITSQHGLIYHKLVSRLGLERAGQYLAANEAALQKYREMCRLIDCGFEEKVAFLYSLNDRGRIERELSALDKLGFPAEWADNLPLPFPIAGAVRFPGQAQFHPLQFVSRIASGLHICEHTRVRELTGNTAVTDHGRIRAGKVLVTTHFPFVTKHGGYFLKLYQQRSYVIALNYAQDVDGMYLDEAKTGLSFRNYNDLLLIGGGHRTGKPGSGWQELERFARSQYPGAQEVCRWATQDCMSLDGVPYIGRYSAATPDWYVATGFNKWGMTSSMVAAMILTDLV